MGVYWVFYGIWIWILLVVDLCPSLSLMHQRLYLKHDFSWVEHLGILAKHSQYTDSFRHFGVPRLDAVIAVCALASPSMCGRCTNRPTGVCHNFGCGTFFKVISYGRDPVVI